MSPADLVALALVAKEQIDRLPAPVLQSVTEFLAGLLTDDSTRARRASGVALARAHKAAVDAAIAKARK